MILTTPDIGRYTGLLHSHGVGSEQAASYREVFISNLLFQHRCDIMDQVFQTAQEVRSIEGGGLVTKTKRVTTQEYKMGDCYCTRCGAPLKSVPLTVYDCDACEEKQKFDAETGEPAQQLVCSACECHTRGHHWATKRHGWFRKAFNRCTRCGQTQPCVGLNY